MKRKRISIEEMLKCCTEPGDEDGMDPKIYFTKKQRAFSKTDKKALQLARQIEETLHYVLDATDPLFSGLQVVKVLPAPDSRRMKVIVVMDSTVEESVGSSAVLAALQQQAPRLRTEIARSINRRKTPTLIFDLVHDFREGEDEG